MPIVRGKNAVALFWDVPSSSWVPVACGRSCSLNVTTDFIETSVSGQGVWRTRVPMSNDGTGNIEGLMFLMEDNKYSIADLRAKQYAQERILVRFDRTDDAANVYADEFYCYISNTTDTNSFDNVSTFTVDIILDGAITQIFTPTPIITGRVERIQFTLPATDTIVSVPDADGIAFNDVLEVSLDGYDYPGIINAGTPAGDEVKFTSSGGTLEFPFPDADLPRNGFILINA